MATLVTGGKAERLRLELSSEGRYAIRALVYLAMQPERVSAKVIATETVTPRRLLARILAALARAGILESEVGRHGGTRIARPASEISLRSIVEAVEGPFRVTHCIMESRECGGQSRCVMHDAWLAAQRALLDELADRSLADLAGGSVASVDDPGTPSAIPS